MAFVDDADVQAQLPIDRVKVEAIPDDRDKAYEDAERIVRGYLAGVLLPATLATWVSPATTPEVIRAITARFAAALIYRVRFSQNSLDDPEFAQKKYNEAMAMLTDVLNGNIVLVGVTDLTTQFDSTYFIPNDDTTDTPRFTMSGRY